MCVERKFVVMSCPEMGTLSLDGGPPYDQHVMDKIAELHDSPTQPQTAGCNRCTCEYISGLSPCCRSDAASFQQTMLTARTRAAHTAYVK